MAHSLGVEIKVSAVEPVIFSGSGAKSRPADLKLGYAATVDDEPFAIHLDGKSAQVLADAFVPRAGQPGMELTLEYLARRLLGSLATSWSGPESSVVQFNADNDASRISGAGWVKLELQINGSPATVWLLCGKVLVERLDGLWRRQVRSSARQHEHTIEAGLEIVQLAVPPAMLVDYTTSGTVVDLEIGVSDHVTLRSQGKPWMPARIFDVGGRFGVQIVSSPLPSAALPEGTTRLSIQFGTVRFDAATASELVQPGAMYETDLAVSDSVNLVINNEKVGSARLCVFEGRFAMTVN
jgi:hypothetical protein